MAIIRCTECNKKISDKASTCPHCGCPVSVSLEQSNNTHTYSANDLPKIRAKRAKQKKLILILSVVLLALVAVFIGIGPDNKNTDSDEIGQMYKSTSKVYIHANIGSSVVENDRLINTFIEILCSDTAKESVQEKYPDSEYEVTGTGVKETQILEITVTSEDKTNVQNICQSTVERFQSDMDRIMPGCTVVILENASSAEITTLKTNVIF